MAEKQTNSPRETTPPPRRSSELRLALIWCGSILGALLLLVLIGLWLTFSGYRSYSAPRLDDRHYQLLRRLASDLRNNRTKPEASLSFKPAEVQYLLDIVRHLSQLAPDRQQVPPAESFMLEYEGRGVNFAVPLPVTGSWCFGGKIYVSGFFWMEKHGNDLLAEVPKLRFGRFDLPFPVGIDRLVPGWRKRLKKELSREFMTSIRSLSAERDGTLVLVYRPQELRRPLKKRLDKVQEHSSGELRVLIDQIIKAL